jgi:hypothetical protein
MEATYCSFAVWTMPTKMPPSIWAEINVPGSPAHPHPQTHPHTHTQRQHTSNGDPSARTYTTKGRAKGRPQERAASAAEDGPVRNLTARCNPRSKKIRDRWGSLGESEHTPNAAVVEHRLVEVSELNRARVGDDLCHKSIYKEVSSRSVEHCVEGSSPRTHTVVSGLSVSTVAGATRRCACTLWTGNR